jgi:predicted AlkP superfamily pyrophosphatase or phosphodiesterase
MREKRQVPAQGRVTIAEYSLRKLILAAAAAALLASPAAAQQPPPPKLLVVISVDQFSANLFDEYRAQFTAGLARLASGTVFDKAFQSHANTETCPGHSTILTGDHPSRTGIIGNTWVDQSIARADKTVYCAEDESAPGSSSTHYKVSPKHLMAPTLGDLLKARWPQSRNVAVSGKDRAAVMMSGHNADQRWYWNGKQFATDLVGVPVPAVLPKVNAAIAAALAQPRPPLDPTPFCQAKARPVPVEGGGAPVGGGRLARAAGDANALRASPELDGDTVALAAGLVDEMQLGRRATPDILSISLSATDYVGHEYGTEGEEMCLQLTELDREIGDFLATLDSRGIDYAVALTADHGGKDIPERERLAGVTDAARVDPALSASVIGKALVAKLGLPASPGLLGDSTFGDMYIDRRLRPAEREKLLKAAVAAYRAHPQVEAVFTAREIADTPLPTTPPETWSLIQRVRASYYAPRSGDFFVVLKKDITPIAHTEHAIATHGSVWDYDRRVPILFWGPGIPSVNIERSAETVDIAPTLAAYLALCVHSKEFDGRQLVAIPHTICD